MVRRNLDTYIQQATALIEQNEASRQHLIELGLLVTQCYEVWIFITIGKSKARLISHADKTVTFYVTFFWVKASCIFCKKNVTSMKVHYSIFSAGELTYSHKVTFSDSLIITTGIIPMMFIYSFDKSVNEFTWITEIYWRKKFLYFATLNSEHVINILLVVTQSVTQNQ